MIESQIKTRVKIASYLLILIFFIPNVSFANGQCFSSGYTVVTINGVFTDDKGAQRNKDRLSYYLGPKYKDQEITVNYLLNPTHAGGFFDLIDSVKQGLFDEKSDYDLIEMLNDASGKVTTQKLLLVGHSQGNFYANNFYDKVAGVVGGVPKKSIRVYAVATPTNNVAGNFVPSQTDYTTSDTDKVIAAVVGRALTILPPNTHIEYQPSDDAKGHSFSDVYLKYQGAKIVSDIESSLGKLQTNDVQEISKPCISPPTLSLGHKIQGAALAVIDHPIDTYNKSLVFMGNKYLALINKAGEVLADAVGSFRNTNSATAILADNQTQTSKSTGEGSPKLSPESKKENSNSQGRSLKEIPQGPSLETTKTMEATPPYSILNNVPIPDEKTVEEIPNVSDTNNIISNPIEIYTTPNSLLSAGGGYPTPYSTPYSTPYETPYVTPYSTPYTTPYETPYATPYPTPYTTPFPSVYGDQVFASFLSTGEFTENVAFNCTTNDLDTMMMYAVSDSDGVFHYMNGGGNGVTCPGGHSIAMGNGQKFADYVGYADYVGWYYVSMFIAPKVCFYNSPLGCVFNNLSHPFIRLHRDVLGGWTGT